MELPDRLHIKVHWIMKIVAAVEALLFPIAGVYFWSNGLPFFAVLLMPMLVMAVYVFLIADSTIDLDQQSITITAPHSVNQMAWDEVRQIETDELAYQFIGDKKALGINLMFAEKGRPEFKAFLERQMELHGIEKKLIGTTPITMNEKLRRQRNARIRGWKLF